MAVETDIVDHFLGLSASDLSIQTAAGNLPARRFYMARPEDDTPSGATADDFVVRVTQYAAVGDGAFLTVSLDLDVALEWGDMDDDGWSGTLEIGASHDDTRVLDHLRALIMEQAKDGFGGALQVQRRLVRGGSVSVDVDGKRQTYTFEFAVFGKGEPSVDDSPGSF